MSENSGSAFAIDITKYNAPAHVFANFPGRKRQLFYLAIHDKLGKCLQLVFETLDTFERIKCACVCNVWNAVVQHGPMTFRRVLLGGCHTIRDSSLSKLCSPYFEHIVQLSVENCGWLTNRAIRTMLSRCSKLLHLNCSGCTRVSDGAFLRCRREHIQKLQVLDLSSTNISDKVLSHILGGDLSKSSKLVSLSLRGCRKVTGTSLSTMRIPDLEELDLSNSGCRDSNTITRILQDANQGLCVLGLAYIYTVSDEHLEIISSKFENLKKLFVNGCFQVSPKGLHNVLETCHTLGTLEVGYRPTELPICWNMLKLQNLTQVSLESIAKFSDLHFLTVLRTCPCLAKFSVSRNEQFGGVNSTNYLLDSACVGTLTYLGLAYTNFRPEHVCSMLQKLEILQNLDARGLGDKSGGLGTERRNHVIWHMSQVRKVFVRSTHHGQDLNKVREYSKEFREFDRRVRKVCYVQQLD